jgi:FtsH-binding integral membrane protein
MKDHLNESAKHVLDGLSLVTVLGALVELLPAVAALFTIIWTGIRIYETDTIQQLLGKKKDAEQE